MYRKKIIATILSITLLMSLFTTAFLPVAVTTEVSGATDRIQCDVSEEYYDQLWVGDSVTFYDAERLDSCKVERIDGAQIEVDNIARVTFVETGLVSIKVTCGKLENFFQFTISERPDEISPSIDPSKFDSVLVGDKVSFVGYPSYPHKPFQVNIEILSGDCVEILDEYYGSEIVFIKPGNATVKVTVGKKSETFSFTISESKNKITSYPDARFLKELWVNDSVSFRCKSVTNSDFTYTSTWNVEILEGDCIEVKDGFVPPEIICTGTGEATIRVTAETKYGTTSSEVFQIKVSERGEEGFYSFHVEEEDYNNMWVGDEISFRANSGFHAKMPISAEPLNGDCVKILYDSILQFTKAGEADVKITCGNTSKVFHFTVSERELVTTPSPAVFDQLWVDDVVLIHTNWKHHSYQSCSVEILKGDNVKIEDADYSPMITFTKAGEATVKVTSGALSETYHFTVKESKSNPSFTYNCPSSFKIGQKFYRNEIGYFSNTPYNSYDSGLIEYLNEDGPSFLYKGLAFSKKHIGEMEMLDLLSDDRIDHRIEESCIYALYPGNMTMQARFDGKVLGDPFTVTVEEPVVETNAPESIETGSVLNLKTFLSNTALDNIPVEEAEKRIHLKYFAVDDSEGDIISHQTNFRPVLEILEGKELVQRSEGDYSHTLESSEQLTFTGTGTVKLRIAYHMIYDTEDISCFPYSYNPEKIVTIQVTDRQSSLHVTLPDKIFAKEDFIATIVTPQAVQKLRLYNESNKGLGFNIVSTIQNPDGSFTTKLRLNVGSPGLGRTLTVYDGTTQLGSFTFDVLKSVKVLNVQTPFNIVKNESFEVQITTDQFCSKLTLKNEAGRLIGSTLVSRKTNEDGTYTDTLQLIIGSAGTGRTIGIYSGADQIGSFVIDVLAEPIPTLDVLLPYRIIQNESFRVTVVTPLYYHELTLKNENGGSIGRKIISREILPDGRMTTVIELQLGSKGQGRTLSVFDGDQMLGSFTFDVEAAPPAELDIVAPTSAIKRQTFPVMIVTSGNYQKLVLTNEEGRGVSYSLISKNKNEDGSYTTVIHLSVGTAGNGRIFDVYDNTQLLGQFQIDILAE